MSPGVQVQSGQKAKTMKPCLPTNRRVGWGRGATQTVCWLMGYKHAQCYRYCQMFIRKTVGVHVPSSPRSTRGSHFSPYMITVHAYTQHQQEGGVIPHCAHLHPQASTCGTLPLPQTACSYLCSFSSSYWIMGIFSWIVVLNELRMATACLN